MRFLAKPVVSLLAAAIVSGSVWWASRGPDAMAIHPEVFGDTMEASGSLQVMTLNVAHGRGTRATQFLTTSSQHRASLDAVGDLLASRQAHVVALQEVDGPSLPTGRFDHLSHLAERSGHAHALRGTHVQLPGLGYGASMLTSVPTQDAASHTFGRTPPTPSKGFVIAEVELDGRPLDVVSVHLDFARSSAREHQVSELVHELRARDRPVVLMGDLNMGWEAPAMQHLVEALSLHTVEAEAPWVTFPSDGTRLDWILASRDLELHDVAVLDDVVSDHLAVVGTVRWAEAP